MPSPIVARAEHEHPRGRRATRACSVGERDRGRRDRHRVAADRRSRCGPACPTRPRGGTVRDEQRPAGRSRSAALPRLADLAEDLALADDHRVEAGGDRRRGARPRRRRSTCRAGRRTRRGRRPSTSARKSRTSPTAGWKCVRARVDLGAVARGEQRRPRRGARARARSWSALGSAVGRHRHPLEQLDRHRAVVQADDDQRHALQQLLRFGRRGRRGSGRAMPESKRPSANRRLRWNARRPAALPGPRESRSSSVAYSGPSSSVERRRRYAASAGLRPPVPT